ncbi:ABC transporter substrate-binding protein [Brunnivagina elsteri]|uniref:Iron ABC transporter substrate-binding protein n=1 Tax=Brunnivagina elsteri CCALA 953 TaxID=987040 RepID=A0A2A2TKH1_9CYAN|nr:ABC transporter substrate-binding protein [Calothrix elsteri]PAX57045.1 iron ABC transporter substrate-binding protein [Calothrix elsteri CCALA 953]
MNKHKIKHLLTIFISLILISCTPSITQQPAINPQTNQAIANRVIALTSLSADIIYQLDKTKIVGISGTQLLNNDPRFKEIPRVSEGRTQPNLEKIIALKPDLVIGASGFNDQTIQSLKKLKINTFETKTNNWQTLTELTKDLAQKTGTDPQQLLKKYESFLLNQSNSKTNNLSTLVIVSLQPILAPNKNSWAGDMLTQFKVKNIAAELQGKSPIPGYLTLSAEKILESNPDAIIVVNSPQAGSGDEVINGLKKQTFWQKLTAVQNNKVYVFEYNGLVNPGSIDSIEKATKKLQEIVKT